MPRLSTDCRERATCTGRPLGKVLGIAAALYFGTCGGVLPTAFAQPPQPPSEGSSQPPAPPTGGGGSGGGGMTHDMHAMPGMKMSDPMGGMSSSIDLLSPMTQEASGTAWLPASSPMYGRMLMYPNGSMLMLHGAITPRYTKTGSARGDHKFDAPNWFMGMYSRPLGAKGQLGLRLMMSLDPLTEGGFGYPLLFQTGETWHGQPLHDRQHPHDLFSEVSASYSRLLAGNASGYLYVGYPGEPAIGPPTFMHRLIAFDLPDAPIGHHWQDATHITFGVVTAGLNFGNRWKVEGSVFNGREPNENRYNFDPLRLDSQSGRVSFNPDANNSFQVSYGFQKNPEGDGVNQHRTTASWVYNRPLGPDANFTTTLSWGQNNLASEEGKSNSYLAEADYQTGRHTFLTRLENIQKSGHELVLPEAFHGTKYALGAYTVGYVYDLTHGRGVDTGVGAAVTVNTKPSALDPFYGTRSAPVGFQVTFRLRPSRSQMSGMDMGHGGKGGRQGAAPTPPTGAPQGTPNAAAITVSSETDPNPPKARQKTRVTLIMMGVDGKPIMGASVSAAVNMTTMDMGTLRPTFKDMGGGRYQAEVTFSMPGPWRLSVTVRTHNGGGNAPPVVTKALDYNVVR